MGERRTAIIIGTTVVIFVAVVLGWAYLSGAPALPGKLAEITDPAVLKSQVQVAHVGIATGINFVGQKTRVIVGTLQNTSDKPLRRIEMKMVFMTYDGKPLQESVQKGYDVRQKPLDPGEHYSFELSFEDLPAGWNHRIPNIEIVKVAY